MPKSSELPNTLFHQIPVTSIFQHLGNNPSGWLVVKDREHRIQFVNQRFADMIGRPCEEIIGLSDVEPGLPDAKHYDNLEPDTLDVHTLDEQCMASGKPTRTIDNNTVGNPGQFKSMLVVRTPLQNDAGEVIGLMRHAIDDSGLQRLETEKESASEVNFNSKLGTLDRLISELLVCHDRQQLLQKITNAIVSQTLADSAYIAVLNDRGEHLELIASTGSCAKETLGTTFTPGQGIIGKAWLDGDIFYTDGAVASGACYTYSEKTQVCALPIMEGDRVVAVMSAALQGENKQSLKDDIPTLRRILNLASIALSNASLLATTNSALQQTRALADVSRQLATTTCADEACEIVCDAMLVALDVCKAATVMIDEHGQHIINAVRHSATASVQDSPEDRIQLKALADRCFDSGVVVAHGVANVDSSDPKKSIDAVNTDHPDCNSFALPLLVHGEITGVICVARSMERRPLERSTFDTLATVTNQLSSTLERLDLTAALQHQAFHDRLTGLPNRHKFEATLQDMLDQHINGALLFIDLDGFKDVNDTQGHAVGDQLLLLVASRLRSHLKAEDTIARVGGDEFVAILRSGDNSEDALARGEQILEALSTSFLIGRKRINIGASIGLSRFPEDGDTVETLLRNADVAMYQAKDNGKGRVLSFDKDLTDVFRQKAQLQAEILIALEQHQFELHYQPQVCCSTGTVLGAEALLRWTHPERGAISPGEFIPAAEQSGLINDIGTWVLNCAAQQIAEWQNTPQSELRVSINIAASQFQQKNFAEQVLSILASHGAPCHCLELEVTESVVMNDVGSVIRRFTELREAGIRIAVDDFGTGYSSLAYLRDLPLDVLKIDRSFISGLQDERADQSLANTIALLASGLGLETVAEGVETTEQHDAVVGMGCHMIQGFYHSRAVPANELPVVIHQLQDGSPLNLAA